MAARTPGAVLADVVFGKTGSRFAWKIHSAGTGHARSDEPGRKDGFLESPDGSLHPLLCLQKCLSHVRLSGLLHFG